MTQLQVVRERFGYTKAEAARRANGMSKSHYGRIECGKAGASYESAKAIASVFNREISEIQIMEIERQTKCTAASAEAAA